ncbi:MAG: hypothetical protein QM658_03435 [Gordonia sp. (in: high G+C Gram-positive bacteria)]
MGYVDENGNPINPEDLADYEPVEAEQTASAADPAPAERPARGKGRWWKIALGLVVVAALAGVVVMMLLRGHDPSEDRHQSKDERAAAKSSESAAPSSSAPAEPSESEEPAAPRKIDACSGQMLKDAQWIDGASDPTMELVVLSSTNLGRGWADRIGADDAARRVSVKQSTTGLLSVYFEDSTDERGRSNWYRVQVETKPELMVTDERTGRGPVVNDSHACRMVEAGTYRVVNGDDDRARVPADAVTGGDRVEVRALKPDYRQKDVVWVIVGDTLLETQLRYVDEGSEG